MAKADAYIDRRKVEKMVSIHFDSRCFMTLSFGASFVIFRLGLRD
jgi:hypothetical protein